MRMSALPLYPDCLCLTAKGTHAQPNSWHFVSLAMCFSLVFFYFNNSNNHNYTWGQGSEKEHSVHFFKFSYFMKYLCPLQHLLDISQCNMELL